MMPQVGSQLERLFAAVESRTQSTAAAIALGVSLAAAIIAGGIGVFFAVFVILVEFFPP